MLDIKVDKNITIARVISNFKNINKSDIISKNSICIELKYNTNKYNIDCKNVIRNIIKENHKNFHKINSYLFIGFESIKNIVLPSISLKSNWLHTNKTHISQNISIIAIQKSRITFWLSHIVSLPKAREKTIKTKAKNIIKYKNLFLTISLKVLNAIFNIKIKLKIKIII